MLETRPVAKSTKYRPPATCQWIDVNQEQCWTSLGHEHLLYKVLRVLGQTVFELEHGNKRKSQNPREIILHQMDGRMNTALPWVMSNTCIKFQGPRSNEFQIKAWQ